MAKKDISITVTAKDSASSVLKGTSSRVKDLSDRLAIAKKKLEEASVSGKAKESTLMSLRKSVADYETKLEEASGKQSRWSQVTAAAASRAGQAIVAATKAATAAGVAFAGAAAMMGIKTAGELETARQGFITLLGSAEAADTTLAQIKEDAAKTPFELNGLVQANQLLTAVTKDGGKSQKILMDVGKSLAAMGKGQAELDRIIVNLQQIGAVGHASMLDVKQFAFAGIPIFEMLQEHTGKTGEELANMISSGEVTFDMLIEMFDKASNGSGRFSKAFENQSGTFQQLVANMKDSWAIFTSDFVTKTGLFDLAKQGIQRVSDFIENDLMNVITTVSDRVAGFASRAGELGKVAWDYLGPKLKNLWDSIENNLSPSLERLWKNVIEPLIPVIGVALVGALGLAIDTITVAIDVASWLADRFTDLWTAAADGNPIVWGLIGVLGTLSGALAIRAGVAAFSSAMTAIQMVHIPKAVTAFKGLSALVSTPLVMPAIAVGAAIAALVLVANEARKTKQVVQEAQAAAESAHNSQMNALSYAQQKRKSGEWTEEQYQRIVTSVSGRAAGGPVMQGQSYLVGERGPEMFTPTVAGSVGPAAPSSIIINFTGNVSMNSQSDADYLARRIDAMQRRAARGMA